MPLSLTIQPLADSLNAIYNPILLEVKQQDGNPSVVVAQPAVCYCSIYINTALLITLTSTAPSYHSDFANNFQFDISGILQPALTSLYSALAFCSFQVAFIGADGTIGDPTEDTAISNSFHVFNMALQNGDGNDVVAHLNKYIILPNNGSAFPLTHRPTKMEIGLNQSDTFPLFTTSISATLRLNYKIVGQPVFHTKDKAYVQSGYTIPFGTMELKALFPTVAFENLSEYYLQLIDGSGNEILTTNTQTIEQCTERAIRVFFTNYLGTIDSVNMKLELIEHVTKSDSYRVRSYPVVQPVGSYHSNNRINIDANNTYTISTNKFEESDLPWLQELAGSPKAWIQGDGLRIPIVMMDGTFVIRKGASRFRYDVQLKFTLSNEFVILRN